MKTIIPLITVLAVCVTTAVVVTVGLRNKSLATTDATLDLTSQAPLVPPAQQHLRGVSAARASTLVSRGADATRGQAKHADPKPAKVVGGGLIVHKTKAQINDALRRAAEREAARQTMTFQIGTFNVLGSQHTTPERGPPQLSVGARAQRPAPWPGSTRSASTSSAPRSSSPTSSTPCRR